MDSSCDIDDVNVKSNGNSLPHGVSNGENGKVEPRLLASKLAWLDTDLAYSAEKLMNLDLLTTMLSLEENGLAESSFLKDNISEVEIEKALTFDLLFGYLDSEVTELEHFLNILRTKIVDANQNIYSCRQTREIFNDLQVKLHGSESSWKHLQEILSNLKQQLANLLRTISIFRLDSIHSSEDENLEKSGWDMQTLGQRRLVLRTLEKSLASELDLEKQLLESKEREEELKSNLSLKNEVVSEMEAFTEVALERLLQEEHSSEIYMGIAKEMMFRLQSLQFNLHCSVVREEKLKSELQSTSEQLKEKEIALSEIESNHAKRCQDQGTLVEKIKLLEEKLLSSESKLQEVSTSYEASQVQLSAMENAVETLREHVFMAESRAHNAETKLNSLTEENMELREELGFLKDGDSNVEKISLLQKQARDLEVELQTAKTTSEANLEQTNMLYTAIWDMETLIEELKTKVSKAESRAENAEEQCLVLAETNLELSKEISTLKFKSESLEEDLKESDRAKVAHAIEINDGAKLITDMVMQLAVERDRIQKQLSSLARENKILLAQLRKMKNIVKAKQADKEIDRKDFDSVAEPPTGISRSASTMEGLGETPTSTTASNQGDEPSEKNLTDEAEAEAEAEGADSSTSEHAAAAVNFSSDEIEGHGKSRHRNKKSYVSAAIVVLILSVLAMSFNWQDISSIIRQCKHCFQ